METLSVYLINYSYSRGVISNLAHRQIPSTERAPPVEKHCTRTQFYLDVYRGYPDSNSTMAATSLDYRLSQRLYYTKEISRRPVLERDSNMIPVFKSSKNICHIQNAATCTDIPLCTGELFCFIRLVRRCFRNFWQRQVLVSAARDTQQHASLGLTGTNPRKQDFRGGSRSFKCLRFSSN
jgi:hypothetical protein